MKDTEIVKPNDCTLLIGIPTTAASFGDAVIDKCLGRRDFACSARFGGLAGYKMEIIAPFERARRQWGRYGAEVLEHATSATVRGHLRRKARGVTILLTHFVGDSVELFDALLGCEEFANMVPADHLGIIDLCMCHPMTLVSSVKQAAPGASICFASAALTPAYWFNFYAHLFRLLKSEDVNYIDAMERTCMTLSRFGTAR